MSDGRRTHHQAPVLYTFRTDEQVREVLDQPGLSFHYDHFEAGVMIEMSMDSGNNLLVVSMLNVRQLLGEKAAMVIVTERDCSHHLRAGSEKQMLLRDDRE